MKYLKKFETENDRGAYENGESYIEPYVSCLNGGGVVHYNKPPETRLIAKYNVTSTSSPTPLRTNYEQNIFKSMEIDGVQLDNLVTEYTFDSVGIHTVKYELYDETKVGNNAPVFNNNALVEVVIPNTVTSFGTVAFQYCTSLSSITIPNSVTSIGTAAFWNCSGLTYITIPNSVTFIGNSAFSNCSGLTSVSISNNVTIIGSSAFAYCSALASVIIPNNVTNIDGSAFINCSGLTSVTVEATTPPTLGGDDIFNNTNNCPIYVPSASVDAYKAASGWSSYASRIQAIP